MEDVGTVEVGEGSVVRHLAPVWIKFQRSSARGPPGGLPLRARERSLMPLYRDLPFAAHHVHEGDPAMESVQERVVSSAEYLAENVERAPVLVIPCVAGRVEAVPGEMATLAQASTYGSILPALWSFMLAARARGLGTCWTTIHLWHEKEAADVLGIPYSEVTQCALTPVAHYKGESFRAGPRKPLDPILHIDRW
jgi:nitroreductase